MNNNADTLDALAALLKRRGFMYRGSDIYGGLAGMWDYGPHGVTLKQNLKNIWWKQFVASRGDIYGLDGAIIMKSDVLQASGHTEGFADPLVADLKTGERYRADHLLEEAGVDPAGMSVDEMEKAIRENSVTSPAGNELGEVNAFNLMFDVYTGATRTEASRAYLRPETAQSIFINFKNIIDSFSPKLPFGIAQIGKAFRNEIAPRNLLFRLREMEQMEVEYFVREGEWEEWFDFWREKMNTYARSIGIDEQRMYEVEIPESERAHYSKRTIDFEFEFPFGQKELWGLAYRTDYDLKKHAQASDSKLDYFDQETGERFIPHVIEPSLGLDRTLLALLVSVYTVDEMGGEQREYLAFPYDSAPVKVAVFPLLKNKPELVEKARLVYERLQQDIPSVVFDDNGNIGKRYRRQDEIGTPYCVTIDFDTLEDETVTIRKRDTGAQERVSIEEISDKVQR